MTGEEMQAGLYKRITTEKQCRPCLLGKPKDIIEARANTLIRTEKEKGQREER